MEMASPPPVLLRVATCAAPTNIAAIKYWGKDDTRLNTPLNSSVSVTLDQDQLRTKTTIAASPSFPTTQLWLNGKPHPLNGRVTTVVREMRALAAKQYGDTSDGPHAWHLRIVSENSFPTAAGLASSAAGYACLAATLAELFGIDEPVDGHLSTIARQGSGSACRSLYGGFVRWERGTQRADGADSRAVQVADEHHWPSLCAVICVVNDKEKDTSSTSGMATSKATSELLKYRASAVVDTRLRLIEAAYRRRDFAAFGKLTMQDSNQFHAVCLDTYPPIFYLNSISRRLIQLVHAYNEFHGEIRAAYTFDAGPNAVVFTETHHVAEIVALVARLFPAAGGVDAMPLTSCFPALSVSSHLISTALLDAMKLPPSPDSVKMLYVTRVGGGPKVLSKDEALVDPVDGTPRLSSSTTHGNGSSRNQQKGTKAPLVVAASLVVTVVMLSMLRRR